MGIGKFSSPSMHMELNIFISLDSNGIPSPAIPLEISFVCHLESQQIENILKSILISIIFIQLS